MDGYSLATIKLRKYFLISASWVSGSVTQKNLACANAASGFQSVQFREIELRLGLSHHLSSCSYGRFNAYDKAYLEQIAQQTSLFELLEAWLARAPFMEFQDFSFWVYYGNTVKEMLNNDARIIEHNSLLTSAEKKQQLREPGGNPAKF